MLVERLKSKPFILLGINSDDALADLKQLRAQGVITWQFWCDGPFEEGPIAGRWNVRGWPTIHVLDAKGVIRYKNVASEAKLEELVNRLLKELEPIAKP